jgi:hypothetical protein
MDYMIYGCKTTYTLYMGICTTFVWIFWSLNPYKVHNFDALKLLFGFYIMPLERWISKFELWNNIESCKI